MRCRSERARGACGASAARTTASGPTPRPAGTTSSDDSGKSVVEIVAARVVIALGVEVASPGLRLVPGDRHLPDAERAFVRPLGNRLVSGAVDGLGVDRFPYLVVLPPRRDQQQIARCHAVKNHKAKLPGDTEASRGNLAGDVLPSV